MRQALICGITGQDGAFLARYLLGKGYKVWGSSRDARHASTLNLVQLGIDQQVSLISMEPTDIASVTAALGQSAPDEIYYLAGQSSVERSFQEPGETVRGAVNAVVNVLEAVRRDLPHARFYNAGSSEVFGDTPAIGACEATPFHPRSPYGIAKVCAQLTTQHYREAYALHACTGILFNHESALRPERFVTQKVVKAAKRIAEGSPERLELGTMEVTRDWGWAPEYVAAMWMMLQAEPADLIISTGVASSLRDFVRAAFALRGLDWQDHVDVNNRRQRPTDISFSRGDPAEAERRLGWRAESRMPDVVAMMTSLA